jgi:hypothetical protein
MSGLPRVERFTLTDLHEVTAEADAYVNGAPSPKQADRRSKEVIESLNGRIAPHYLHQLVSIYGIHKKVHPDKRNNLHVYMKDGELSGMSDGFIVVDFDKDFEDIGKDEYPMQNELYERLRLFAPDRYAVSHLVRLGSIGGRTDDFLIEQGIVFRGFAPAFANELFMEEDVDIPDDSKLLETERLINLTDESKIKYVEHIRGVLEQSDDPLPALIANARKFRGMDQPTQYSLHRMIQGMVKDNLIGQSYEFQEGLPLFFLQNSDGSGTPKTCDYRMKFMIADVCPGPHYEVSTDGESGTTSDESALYLAGYEVTDGVLGGSLMVVPLEYLHKTQPQRLDD